MNNKFVPCRRRRRDGDCGVLPEIVSPIGNSILLFQVQLQRCIPGAGEALTELWDPVEELWRRWGFKGGRHFHFFAGVLHICRTNRGCCDS